MKVIKFTPNTIKWCTRRGILQKEIWDKKLGGKNYNHNKVESNIVGVRGEVAAYNYLKLGGPVELTIQPNFMEVDNEKLKGDIVVPPILIGKKPNNFDCPLSLT
jgi:hypothetical protein